MKAGKISKARFLNRFWAYLAYVFGYARAQADEHQQREGTAEDTFGMLIQQQWDAGEKRLKEIIVAISAFGDFGKDVHHSRITLRISTAQEIAAGLEELKKLYRLGYASDSLAEYLWKESVTLVALLSRCADESARRGHDVTAKREFIATVQPRIESLGEDLGWRA